MINNLNHKEVSGVDSPSLPRNQIKRTTGQPPLAKEGNGVSVRIDSEFVTMRYYPSMYDWLEFQCSIWVWEGGSLPSPEDPRIALSAERYTAPSDKFETSHPVYG